MAHITIDGTTYPMPQTSDLTLGEMEAASALGAKVPTSSEDALDPTWVRALICIAMRRAGETVDPEALKELRFGDIDWEEDPGDAVPPPNRAQRRAGAKTAKRKSGS